MDELDALDTVRLGIALLSLALMVLFVGRRFFARTRARRVRPVRATVVAALMATFLGYPVYRLAVEYWPS